jgi:hypothetical protein
VSTLTRGHVHFIGLTKSAEPEILSFTQSLKSKYAFIKFLCIYSQEVYNLCKFKYIYIKNLVLAAKNPVSTRNVPGRQGGFH